MDNTDQVPLHSPETASDDPVSILIAGDCIFPPQTDTVPFGPEIQERIQAADLALVNLEAPVTDDPRPLSKSGPHKYSAENSAELLAEAGFDGVTLANNHIMDYGVRGLEQSIRACDDAGLAHVGAGDSIEAAFEPLVSELGEGDVSVLNFCEREFGEATADSAGTAWFGHPRATAQVGAACEYSDVVVAVIHGGTEYVPLPPPHLQDQFRELIDLGVDLVVGHHPHVPQGWERYGDGLIVYSLGNFLFNQSKRPSTQWGATLVTELGERSISDADLLITRQRNGRVQEVDEPHRSEYVEHLERLSTITGDADSLASHWQSQAVRIFHLRYTDWLATGVGTNIRQWASHPSRLLHAGGNWDVDERGSDLLVLLNLIRNASHRGVLQTALEVETGVVPDRRTSAIEEEVDALLRKTDDDYPDGNIPTVGKALDKVINRVLPGELRN